MIKVAEPMAGLFVLKPNVFADGRGSFVKTYHSQTFAALGLNFVPAEEFFSTSHKNVLRGMHFQTPPHDHDKLVYCARGRALDVILDLRKSSVTFGKVFSLEINAENHLQVYIPKGMAHGFYSLEDDTMITYQTTTVHTPASDAGIRWDSIDFDWGASAPIISDRDKKFPSLAEYKSPF